MSRLPEDLLARLVTNPFRRPNEYTEWAGHRLLNRTFCKRCGLTLTVVAPDPRFPVLNRELAGTKIRTIIQTAMVSRQRTPEFDSIEFEVQEPDEVFVPEGDETQDITGPKLGAHRTAICKTCKAALLDGHSDLEEVQHLYEADLENMAQSDEAGNVPAEQTLSVLTRLATRKVTRILG
jgi:hypothetical protein